MTKSNQSEQAPHYMAVALQLSCPAVNSMSVAESRESITKTIEHVAYHVPGSKKFIGMDTQLVVLPEYFLTGYPLGESIEEWRAKAAIDPDGAEYDALAKIAQDSDVYLSGNVYETDPHFSGLYFQTSFIIDPSGNTILRYRRLISMFAPTPHDVWDKYLDIYGLDAVFPVVDTELGRLACCASEEILYPEICRAHAARGAEVILHSSSEAASNGEMPKDIAKRARAIENSVYVVSSNSGGISGSPIPTNSVDSMSKIIDHRGLVLSSAGYGESMVANAEIDLAPLRRYRRKPSMSNVLARQRFELFSHIYSEQSIYPANTLLDDKQQHRVPDRSHFVQTQLQTIAALADKKII